MLCGRLCFSYKQWYWPRLWNKQSLALGELFYPALESYGHLGGCSLQSVFLTLGLLPSWDSRPVYLLLIQKGCSGMGWLEFFCLCLDPGLEQGWCGYKEHTDMEVKHLEKPLLFSPDLCS